MTDDSTDSRPAAHPSTSGGGADGAGEAGSPWLVLLTASVALATVALSIWTFTRRTW